MADQRLTTHQLREIAEKLSPVEKREIFRHLVARQSHQESEAKRADPTKRELEVAELLRTKEAFQIQRDVFWAPHKRKAIRCTRRAGKTVGIALKILHDMLAYPSSRHLYLALTADNARSYIWQDIRMLCDKYDLTGKVLKFDETRLWIKHVRGGGLAIFAGANDKKQVEKFRGQKWSMAIIDEAGTYPESILRYLVQEVIGASLRDMSGTFILAGTPGRVPVGFWYDAYIGRFWNEEKQLGWKPYFWSLQDNPHLSADAKNYDLICVEDGLTRQDPRFIREYLGQPAIGDDALVFKYDPTRNVFDGQLPTGHVWKYLAGCDFGWEDESAVAVVAYALTTRQVYIMETWAKRHAHADELARELFRLKKLYPIHRVIGDIGGAGKFYQQSLSRDYGIAVEAAQKMEKLNHIDFMNSAFLRGDIKIKKADPICEEYLQVAWNEDHDDIANHSKDNRVAAALYAWRAANNFAGKRIKTPEIPADLQTLAANAKIDTLRGNNEREQPHWFNAGNPSFDAFRPHQRNPYLRGNGRNGANNR